MLEGWTITAQELQPLLVGGTAVQTTLLDVREPEENEESRIAGSTLIPLGELSARAQGELNPEHEIIIYCAHGVRSLQALLGLRQLGFEKLKSLEGGICAWEEAGLPVERG
jgi:rhodanese-related sulfurtransferase